MPRNSPPGIERLVILVTRLQHALLYDGTGVDAMDFQLLEELRPTVNAIAPAYEVALIELERDAKRD